jgi:molybdopterin-guanine dinucleotide biosynthesis protein A
VPAPGGRAQPLAAAYRPAAVAPLRAALERGERAVTRAVLALGPALLDDAALMAIGIDPEAFDDIDTREDLARLESRPR